jgi:glycosyltransferase involved in cell wall biosynthesis
MNKASDDRNLRIAVDARCLNCSHLRGMGRYVREVITRIRSNSRSEWHLFGDRPDLPFHLSELPGTRKDIFVLRGSRFRTWEQFALPWHAMQENVDVLHCPATAAPWWQPVPTIVTVHDTLAWAADDPDLGAFTERLLPIIYRKAASIITISKSSRNDIIGKWPHLDSKLHVIPHGVDDIYLNAEPAGLTDGLRVIGVRQPYLLYLGGELLRKRAEWAVDVLAGLRDPHVSLVLCGLSAAAQARVRAAARPEIRGRLVFTPFIPDSDLVRLYQNAVCLLYPTLYEGFGFPALEAQAVGTPAVFSAVGSLAELQGPGAVVLPPHELPAWVDACMQLLAQRRQQSRPNEDARRWARQFSWDVSAARHLQLYQKAASNVGHIAGDRSPSETHHRTCDNLVQSASSQCGGPS